MSWLSYVFKTSLKQKKQDWADYKSAEEGWFDAMQALCAARSGVEKLFEEEVESTEYNACIKRKILFSHLEKSLTGRLTGREICTTVTSRCLEFAPIGDEKPCSRYMCEAYYKNKQYVEALQKYKKYEQEYKNFWKQKVNQK